MPQYPPPPPPDQQHYHPNHPIYPSSTSTQPVSPSLRHDSGPYVGPNSAEHNEALTLAEQLRSVVQPAQHSEHDPALGHVGIHGPPQVVPAAGPASVPGQTQDSQKQHRLRKACDACGERKVRCSDTLPCEPCQRLGIECTFDRPSKRRGPPNRVAERRKRTKLTGEGELVGQSGASSPTQMAHALTALKSPSTIGVESICSREIVSRLVDDFFTYIHPLCPFPHRPTFRAQFDSGEDYRNPPFLALLASMVAILTASFPRKVREELNAFNQGDLFPTHSHLIQRCLEVCSDSRGFNYVDKEDINVNDAATSYFIGLTHAYTFRSVQTILSLSECLTILRLLGLHRSESRQRSDDQSSDGGRSSPDLVTQEIGRRIFWTVFVSIRTMDIFTRDGPIIILPETPTFTYPPKPVEVDDEFLHPDNIENQPANVVSFLTGFNANVRIYQSVDGILAVDYSSGVLSSTQGQLRKKALEAGLRNCHDAINELPPELKVWSPYNQHVPFGLPFWEAPSGYSSATQAIAGAALTGTSGGEILDRRKIQYEIQKANIYASQLSTRVYIVDRYSGMAQTINGKGDPGKSAEGGNAPPISNTSFERNVSSPEAVIKISEEDMTQERESIIQGLLTMVKSVSRVHMEPNSISFSMKVRQVASLLLNSSSNSKSFAALRDQTLLPLVDLMSRLERMGPDSGASDASNGDESDLRRWADIRDYQAKLAARADVASSFE
ncbi:hypothetical protein P152DRAFT_172846 [Eremomyces bilateralis CBS 781.70]|uniref:Zn(2)-C6 fungal-type domain-containing protein n=1 Tax=Eremomyces bilateralis CBS 781.70 TaxID=1392243 RepID=A0A6G1FSZ7_9PEZI|nr:uncharacterized protein P152DRAFT_172846 [Eremomyces bilateralis CBS 781.70]KAF1808995.1 hypothetical protein P152DRAFT_172846 [Eremomyces bilateralis CBS 781.70]